MPTRELLSSAQRTQFLCIPSDMSEQMQARYYTFSDDELDLIKQHRRNHNRLGFAVQLAYLRFPGRNWAANEEVSPLILSSVANQLKIDPTCIALYGQDREATRYEHLAELEKVCGFRPFTKREYRELAVWLLPIARKTDAGTVLVSSLIEEMRSRKIIIPALSTVERLGWETRRRAERSGVSATDRRADRLATNPTQSTAHCPGGLPADDPSLVTTATRRSFSNQF